ncbi:unnamed protein product, partial [Nesidiocoris tenuis]
IQLSRSGRFISCQNPIAWPNSWTTMPRYQQRCPSDNFCSPLPTRPTEDQQAPL